MKAKLAAFGALVIIGAIYELFLVPHSFFPSIPQGLVTRLLPPAIGRFRRTERWEKTLDDHTLEVAASYRDTGGVEAKLDIWLDARVPHNGVACWYVRDLPVLSRGPRTIRMANASAVFYTALFHDDRGLVLLGNTQCYSTGCRESLISKGFGLGLPVFSVPTPVSVLVRERNDPPGEDPKVQEARLVQGFERFAAGLDLSPLVAAATANRAKGAQPTVAQSQEMRR